MKEKKLFFIPFVISILLSYFSYGQTFEGSITYKRDIKVLNKMKSYGIGKEQLIAKMEMEGTWFDSLKISYKNGYYHQLNYSTDKSWVIYRPDSNSFFTIQEGEASDLVVVTNAGIDKEKKLNNKKPTVTLLDSTVELNGVKLEIVKIQWKSGAYYYYFNRSIFKTNPHNFIGHVYDGFYEYLKISNCYPVVIQKVVPGMMITTQTMVSFKKENISDSLFKLPKMVFDPELTKLTNGNSAIWKIIR